MHLAEQVTIRIFALMKLLTSLVGVSCDLRAIVIFLAEVILSVGLNRLRGLFGDVSGGTWHHVLSWFFCLNLWLSDWVHSDLFHFRFRSSVQKKLSGQCVKKYLQKNKNNYHSIKCKLNKTLHYSFAQPIHGFQLTVPF